MASPMVATRLYIPKVRPGKVHRPALIDRLQRGTGTKLTLISAPAGFGKTTLLAEWLAATSPGRGVAWISLDGSDNEPAIFWSRLIAALRTASPDIGATALNILLAGQQPDEAILSTLLNDLNGLPNRIELVLDDYHVIDRSDVQAGVAYLLEYLPTNVHVTISTRADPALPLARMRAGGDLLELRSVDLRFTAAETAAYLNDKMGLGLNASDIAAVEGRTEGWIAAVQLAALSMRGRDDPGAFIASFAGNDRYIVDYLVEEVLQQQSDEVRSFLLRTCLLNRLTGSLCDAVTGGTGGRAMLQTLERQNLFVVPLDDRRQWYRYHHLFADVLLTHFADEVATERTEVHLRASLWYQRNGEQTEAVNHALAGNDRERAADLIELAIPAMSKAKNIATLGDWLRALPDGLVRARPALGVGLVGVLVANGELGEVEARLDDAERAIETTSASPSGTKGGATDRGSRHQLAASIEMYRAAMAQVRGDVRATITHASRAVDLALPGDDFGLASACGFVGIASWTNGDLKAATNAWTRCVDGLQRGGYLVDAMSSSRPLAEIAITQGRLREAERVYSNALEILPDQGAHVLTQAADMYAGLSGIRRERNELRAARQALAGSEEQNASAGAPLPGYRWHIAMAQLARSEGDRETAVDLLREAERLYVSDYFPNLRPVAAMTARVLIEQGQLAEAVLWKQDAGIGADDEVSFLREFEHLTLARLLIARREDALDLLERMLDVADRGARTGSVIEILALRAIAQRMGGDVSAALTSLERTLLLAEPEGYVRVFVDEGAPMAALLKIALKRGIAQSYTRRLLAAFDEHEPKARVHPDLIEPLSERELDVLRLLRSDLDGPDIARELTISLNTMRTHTKNVYEKLGVNNRRSAVRRAEELGLLQRHR